MKKINIRKEYQKCFNYLKESKKFVWWSVGIFFVFVLLGAFVPVSEVFTQKILEYFEEIIAKTQGFNLLEWFWFLLSNNSVASFLGLFLGMFFGVYSIFASVANGFMVGFVGALTVESEGILSLWRILPHGIFELPAVFISLGMGLKLSSFIFYKNKSKNLKSFLINSLRVFFLAVVPLLIVAAFIEGSLIYFSG